MLLMAAVNHIFLGLDIYLAHMVSGTIVPNEWIPIIYGPAAGLVLLVLGLLAQRYRGAANILANILFIASIGVGILGAYFHVARAALQAGPAGQQISIYLLIWAPPIIGPLTFSLAGWLGISAAWLERPANSGTLVLSRRYSLHITLPYSKTRAYYMIVGLGCLATVISAVLDHARTGFENPWLWIPTVVGIFATAVALITGFIDKPTRTDLWTFAVAMGLMILVALVGAGLHIGANLTDAGLFVEERFRRGAPVMAPLLFANMGTLGLIAMLDPREEPAEA